jgi:hypothetical protein
MAMQWWMSAVISCGALLLCATGCNFEFKPRGWQRTPGPLAMASPGPGATGPLAMKALPAYRLVASWTQADAPSRLQVIQVQLWSTDDGALSLRPEDLVLVLPTGEQRRVFDRDRALELLNRTKLARGDLSYLQGTGYVPTGLDEYGRQHLTATVMRNLLAEGLVNNVYSVQGYVVVDTGNPLASLDGASLVGVARRLSDSAAAGGTYQFAATAPAAAGVPVAGAAPAAAGAPAGTQVDVPNPTPAVAAALSADALPTAAAMPRWARRFGATASDIRAAGAVPAAPSQPAADTPPADVHVPTPSPVVAAVPSADALPTATAMPRWARRFAPSAPDIPAADTVPAAASQPAADTAPADVHVPTPAPAAAAPSVEALPTATAMPRWARRFAPAAPDIPAADTVPAAASQPAADTPPAVATTPEAQ